MQIVLGSQKMIDCQALVKVSARLKVARASPTGYKSRTQRFVVGAKDKKKNDGVAHRDFFGAVFTLCGDCVRYQVPFGRGHARITSKVGTEKSVRRSGKLNPKAFLFANFCA